MVVSALLVGLSITTTHIHGTAAQKDSLAGDWILIEQFADETHAHPMTLEVTGNKITGRSGSSKIDGDIANGVITLKWLGGPDGNRVEATYTGKAQNGILKGDGDWGGLKLQWNARRPAARPASASRTHTFAPTEFLGVFSWAISPAMRIHPGDTVKTKSVDAGGMDENSVRRSMGGNPLTGPFFVEGVLPGDTLVVKLNRVRTNRDWAGSGQSIVGNALSPGYLMNLNRAKDFSSRWKLDPEKGIAYLDKPTDPLKPLTIPLQPMLGCVGVAPPGRDVIRTADSGIFGGNMDYNQIKEGTTVYLPVFHEGALLFMGDGHAAQGDGELTGDALETSMEFEFTVDVISGKSIGTPRAENAEYLMLSASAARWTRRCSGRPLKWLAGWRAISN
jgi:acetamidase/formamidase